MKPNFALVLEPDHIALLQHEQREWLPVGEVALGSADFARDLTELRQRAQDLAADAPLRSKLVLPYSQILYTRIPAHGDDDPSARVAAALEGATPYRIDELAFVWTREGDEILIAAVARETLDEAEEFAAQYGFGPVCFVSAPDPEDYPGEPFFGRTGVAETLLPLADSAESDGEVVRPPANTAAMEMATAEPVVAAEPSQEPEAPNVPEPADLPDAGQTLAESETPPVASIDEATEKAEQPQETSPDPEPDLENELSEVPPPETTPDPVPTFASRRSRQEPPVSAPKPATAAPARSVEPPRPIVAATSRAAIAEIAPQPLAADRRSDLSEAEALTVFGARKSQRPERAASRLRYLSAAALAGVVVLGVIWSLGIADRDPATETEIVSAPPAPVAQSTTGIGSAEAPVHDNAIAASPPPGATSTDTPEEIAPEADVASVGVTSDLSDPGEATASSPPDATLSASDPEIAPVTTGPGSLDPVAARAAYAVSGIWQRAPEPGFLPSNDEVESLYIASIDPTMGNQDAFALPEEDPVADRRPSLPDRPDLPTGSGTESAAPDDTPGNVEIRLGTPEVVPPPRPDALAQEETPEAPAGSAAFSDTRPRTRPTDLVEQTEKATLGGRTRSELATLRPKTRPVSSQETFDALEEAVRMADAETAAAQEEAESGLDAESAALEADLASATRNAIATSPAPRLRPSNIGQIADRARQRAAQEAQAAAVAEAAAEQAAQAQAIASARARAAAAKADAEQAAAAANARADAAARAEEQKKREAAAAASAAAAANAAAKGPAVSRAQRAKPTAPSSASVARRATIKNAVALNKVSLIGVYGTSSQRRALVRLPSGRYVKVKVGDRIDGGRVASIGQSDLRYSKGSRTVTLKMPKG